MGTDPSIPELLGNCEIGQILHLKAEIINLRFDDPNSMGPEISNFGYEF